MLSLTVVQSRPGQTDTFTSALGNGALRATGHSHPFTRAYAHSPDPSLVKCLFAASNADGAAVVLGNCSSANARWSWRRRWTVPKGAGNASTLQIFGDKVRVPFLLAINEI